MGFVLKFAIMTVTFELEPDVELTAIEQAREAGLPLTEYAESVFKEAVLRRKRIGRMVDRSLDEILAPVRKGFAESGESEDEIMAFFEGIREEVYQEKLRAK